MDIVTGVDRQQIVQRHVEVRHLVFWWVTRHGYRRRLVFYRGFDDFYQAVWLRLLKTFADGRRIDMRLTTAITKNCKWELSAYEERFNSQRPAFRRKLWLSRVVQEEDSVTLQDAAAEYDATELRACIAAELSRFHHRERMILIYRFGLCDQQDFTLDELGAILGISHQRVEQLVRRLIAKLRKSSVLASLAGVTTAPELAEC